MKLYRYLTGPDEATFCLRVTEALNRGWNLYGNPTLAADGARTVAGQALTKEIKGPFTPDIDLANL